MEIDYQTIYDYLHCGKCPASHGQSRVASLATRDYTDGCMCKPQASNAEQSEEVCHQGWVFYTT